MAIAGAIVAEASAVDGFSGLGAASQTHRLLYLCGLGAFFVLGMSAAVGLSARLQSTSRGLIGQAHAGVLRYALVLVGIFAVLTFSLAIARVDVRTLLVSGAVVGVVLGIAAQQSLANLFAGLVLLFAHPFQVGSHVRLRAGALGGAMDGLVTDVGLTYVRLETEDGPVLVPNMQVLAAAVFPGLRMPAAGVDAPVTPAPPVTAAPPVSAAPVVSAAPPGGAGPGANAPPAAL